MNNANRVQVDAVYEGFKAVQYQCITCGKIFKAREIREHYKNHTPPPGEQKCAYCSKPCYKYCTDTGETKIWHDCLRP